MGSMTLDLATPTSWPLRMVRSEICAVLRISDRELRRRVFEGRFPKSDDGRTWDRETVERYAKGGIKAFERAQRRAPLQMVRAK
jgi:hypothetical protein